MKVKACLALCALLLAAAPAAAQRSQNVAHFKYLGLIADPVTATAGSSFYRSDLDTFRIRALSVEVWDGSTWRPITYGDKIIHGIRFVNPALWPGGTVTADIDAAISDCASSVCLVAYPSSLGAGEATTVPENAAVFDLRQGALTPPTAGFEAGIALRRRLTLDSATNYRSKGGLWIGLDADDGGQYDSTSKDTYSPLHVELNGRARGQHILIGGQAFGYGIGDVLFLGGSVYGWGGKTVTGTSQPTAEFAEINVKQGYLVFTAQVSGDPASGATSINYASDANESVLGERALINISKTSTAGTVTSISTDQVNFDATAPDWNAGAGACNGVLDPCNPIGQYFKINADDVTIGGTSTGHWFRVIAVVDTDTFQVETTYDTNRLASSGAYTLAQGAEITAFNASTNNLTIEANSYDWAASDNLISPPMPHQAFRGLNLILDKQFKIGSSRALNISNPGPFAWYVGILLEGAPAGANAFDDGIAITAKVDDAIDLASANIASAALKLASNQKLRWATDADFSFDGSKFTFNKGAQLFNASASILPLWIRHAASPSVDYFVIENSTPATIFSIDDNPDGQVNVKCAFGTGLKLNPNTGPTVAACGANTNIVLDLITKGTGAVRVNAQNSSGTGGFAVYDGAATPLKIFSVTSTGVGPNDRGFKHGRVTTGSIGAGLSAAVTLTWTTAFADANYTATCSLVEATASTSTLRLHHIESVAAGSVILRVVNDDGAAAHTGTLHCTAIHD